MGEWVIVSGNVFLCSAAVLFLLALNAVQVSMHVLSQWLRGRLGNGDKQGKGTCQTFGRVVCASLCFLNPSTVL